MTAAGAASSRTYQSSSETLLRRKYKLPKIVDVGYHDDEEDANNNWSELTQKTKSTVVYLWKQLASYINNNSNNNTTTTTTTTGNSRSEIWTLRDYQKHPSSRKNNDNSKKKKNNYFSMNNNTKGIAMLLFWAVLITMSINTFSTLFLSNNNNSRNVLTTEQEQRWNTMTPEEQEWIIATQKQSKKKLLSMFTSRKKKKQPKENTPTKQQEEDKQRHYVFDLPPPLKRKQDKTETTATNSVLRSMEDKTQTSTTVVYDCLPDIHKDTDYKIENMKLPDNTVQFNIRIVGTTDRFFQKFVNHNLVFGGYQLLFSLPRGFGGPELVSNDSFMTVDDLRKRLEPFIADDAEHHDIHPVAMIEQYVEGQPLDNTITASSLQACPNYQDLLKTLPFSAEAASPKSAPKVTTAPSPSPPSSAPTSKPRNSSVTQKDVDAFNSGMGKFNSVISKHDNVHPVEGPWEECLGWQGEDCHDFITLLVPDQPRFQYFAVRWDFNDKEHMAAEENSVTSGGKESALSSARLSVDANIESWTNKHNEEEGHWNTLGMSSVQGVPIALASVMGPNLQRVVIQVNSDNIVVNVPTRG